MADIRDEVRTRAGGCCEYCRISDALVSTPFQLDHIIAEKHGRPTSLENLSWSCLDCNSFKGPNIAGRDDNQTVRLFDPRKDDWKEHFDWNGPILVGRTAIGRATIDVLRINLTYRIAVRSSLIDEKIRP